MTWIGMGRRNSFFWQQPGGINKVAVKLIAVNSSEELRILVWADNKRSTGMEVDTDLTAKL